MKLENQISPTVSIAPIVQYVILNSEIFLESQNIQAKRIYSGLFFSEFFQIAGELISLTGCLVLP